jgi:peptidoglycan/xylan/chitin deacetylase (PgdA/CDA1 family)
MVRVPNWRPSPLIRVSIVLHVLALAALIAAPHLWRWALAAVLANHAVLALSGLLPRCRALGPNWTRLPAAAAARNQIALTLDDGPDPEVTPQVLAILERHAAHATFFCIGERAARHTELCQEIVRRGHSVENHSQHHFHHFALLGMRGLRREIQAAQDTLTAITGRAPAFFRAPAGIRSPRDLKPGAILLLHDGHSARTPAGVPVIIAVLPALLEAAAAAGLRTVTLDQALHAETT